MSGHQANFASSAARLLQRARFKLTKTEPSAIYWAHAARIGPPSALRLAAGFVWMPNRASRWAHRAGRASPQAVISTRWRRLRDGEAEDRAWWQSTVEMGRVPVLLNQRGRARAKQKKTLITHKRELQSFTPCARSGCSWKARASAGAAASAARPTSPDAPATAISARGRGIRAPAPPPLTARLRQPRWCRGCLAAPLAPRSSGAAGRPCTAFPPACPRGRSLSGRAAGCGSRAPQPPASGAQHPVAPSGGRGLRTGSFCSFSYEGSSPRSKPAWPPHAARQYLGRSPTQRF